MNTEHALASWQPPIADGDLCGPQGLAQRLTLGLRSTGISCWVSHVGRSCGDKAYASVAGLTALLKMDRHNMSWVRYPSHVSPAVEDVIAAQSVISRCTHVYVAVCVPLSLVTGLFSLSVFIRGCTRLGVLDRFLAGLTVTSILATLLSLNAASRPDYMYTTHLGCGALSFFSNVCYFTAQHLQGAMLKLSLLPGSSGCRLLARPVVSLAAIGGCAVCSSLILVSLLGTFGELHTTTMCQADPLTAWPEYEIVKFSLGFALALSFQMVLFFLRATQPAWRVAPAQRDITDSGRWVVLAVALNMFACRLFFNAVLLHRARLKLWKDVGSPRDELLMNLAELVLSGESCINSVAILLLHTPCRLGLLGLFEHLTQRCRQGLDNSMPLNRVGG
ncbi:uncharacterized protein LOC127203336 [Acomys russatus]|uniref:uncharacterized protein LOC127203336 n=1 Tax=Acomys russatus TaxID=60746 RepID=UPI0021E2225A|nr:uncharacterized protein LOC127203336 [Acomys russatus]